MLIERIRATHGNHFTASEAVEAVLDTIVRAVAEGEGVSVTGFGALTVVDMASRWARNPATGQRVLVPPTKKVRFRAGQNLLDLVTGAKPLPSGSAIKKAPKGSVTKVPAKV